MNQVFPQISPMALVHRLKGNPKATVLDVRSPAEYQSGHIPGARLIPFGGRCSHRCWSDHRRHHPLVWYGAIAGAHALEPPSRLRSRGPDLIKRASEYELIRRLT